MNKNISMKGRIPRSLALNLLLLLLTLPAFSQRSRVEIHSLDSDSIQCGAAISAYRTFYKENLYDIAQPTWLRVFDQCPDSSQRIYVDGAAMYRHFIESTPDGLLREARIDTLMLIYDRRMMHFGGEGNVLGRKGKDLLAYRGSEISQVQQANEMLRKSIEIQGQESQEAVMQLCISSGAFLFKKGLLEQEQLIADYVRLTGILVRLEKQNSRWRRTRTKINERLLKDGILSCKALNNYFEPLMEQYKNDTAFQETVIYSYNPLECDRSAVVTAASENLYQIAPGPESAHNLALLFIAGNDLQKADFYLKEALNGENIADETRAQWYYELSVVSNGLGDYCQSITYAREAIGLKSSFGQAYIGLGDAIISSRRSLGDDFQRRTAYWAAADMYETAASVDPSVSEEARKKLARCLPQFPDREDIFFSDIREGESYVVEGCINQTTTVRAGN